MNPDTECLKCMGSQKGKLQVLPIATLPYWHIVFMPYAGIIMVMSSY